MLFNVAGLIVEVSKYVHTTMDMGCCCAHMYVCSIQILKGGGDSPPPWPYVEKTLHYQYYLTEQVGQPLPPPPILYLLK